MLLLALSTTLLLSAQSPHASDTSNHVVIISLDGFKASALADGSLPLPTLRRLAARGATAQECAR